MIAMNAPELMKDWHRTSLAIASSPEPSRSELVKIRASQINGCANCRNMHTAFARENGSDGHKSPLPRQPPDDRRQARRCSGRFRPLRPKLMRLAYRMLGSMADAEDMVQEAFIRWMRADRSEVREPEAFLRRTVTRLCLDQLKSARRQRETYVGPGFQIPSWKRNNRKTSPCR